MRTNILIINLRVAVYHATLSWSRSVSLPHPPLPPWDSSNSWSLGQADDRLSYYNGVIQLAYHNGSQYNTQDHILRSTLISFLCDPDAGVGAPEFQVCVSAAGRPYSLFIGPR